MFNQYRTAAASDHESAEFRIQRRIDATDMAYIAFTGSTGYAARGLALGYNNTPQLYVDGTSGNVGIGTTGPAAPLHILKTAANYTTPAILLTGKSLAGTATMRMVLDSICLTTHPATDSSYSQFRNRGWSQVYQQLHRWV